MGRYKSLCLLKSFLFCAPQLSGARIVFFPILSPLRAHLRADCSGCWLDGHGILCLLIRQATFCIHNRSKYNESLKYCENYQTVTQRQEVSKGCWKNGTDRLLLGVTNLQFVNAISMKLNKAKHNKMMCICILS